MQNFHLIYSILNKPWLIMPEAVDAYLPTLKALLGTEQGGVVMVQPQKAIEASGAGLFTAYQAAHKEVPAGSVGYVPIMGAITKRETMCNYGTESYIKMLRTLEMHDNIGAIMLHIDSPGGQADGLKTLAETVKNLRKPVLAFVDGTAASAAYWVASATTKILASEPTDMVGSIGAMFTFADQRERFEKEGIKIHRVAATQSPDKLRLSEEVMAGNYDNLRADMLDQMAQSFIDGIRANRPIITDTYLTGNIYTAQKAMGVLVDGIATFEEALEQTKALIQTPNIKTYYV